MKVLGRGYKIDLAAKKFFAAEKDNKKIAVEIKSFLASSLAYEFHSVLGQYLNYLTFMEIQEPDRILFLAVLLNIFQDFFQQPATQLVILKYKINIVVFSSQNSSIVEWLEQIEK